MELNLFENTWDIISPGLIFLAGFFFAYCLGRIFSTTAKRSYLLYLWHTLWCMAYLIFTLTNGGDALGYYFDGLSGLVDFSFGTEAIKWFTHFFAYQLQLSYVSCFLIFNFVGLIGFICFDSILQSVIKNRSLFIQQLGALIIFLPSISFWSSAIGKDAFSFSSAVLVLWASLDLKHRVFAMIFAILLMLFVRPHIAALILLSLLINSLFDNRLKLITRLIFLVATVIGLVYLLPFATEYAGVDNLKDTSDAIEFIELKQSYNQDGGGGIDISKLSLPAQLFSYLFRPSLFDIKSFLSFFAAIDNLVLLVIIYYALIGFAKGYRLSKNLPVTFYLAYITICWLVLAVTTANLGISIRQKWMFLPSLLYISFCLAGRIKSPTKNLVR